MSLAQQLCDEIVEPALTPSGEEHVKQTKSTKKNHGHAIYSNSKPVSKVCRSVVIEKKKVINKVLPKNSTRGASVINQYKSKEVVSKKFNDTAINTLVSGPLRCDTDCVTIVRRRDSYGSSCKCGVHKHGPSKLIAKEIQMQDFKQYGFSDKACSHIIQTASCGTQFWSAFTNEFNKKSLHTVAVGNTNSLSVNPGYYPSKSREKPFFKDLYQSNLEQSNEKPIQSTTTSPSVRRWALSKYPLRGPDF